MNESLAQDLGQQAIAHLGETSPETLAWARGVSPNTFRNLRLKQFLTDYCWVVYASGFSFAVIENKFPELKTAFKDFDPAALSRMRSTRKVLSVFNNERKASNFLAGAKAVIKEGFSSYKKRLAKGGAETLLELPGIGPITKDHLAKNIGLADVAKADIWLERAAAICGTTVTELTTYLAGHSGESQHTIDVAIWTFGKDGLFNGLVQSQSGR